VADERDDVEIVRRRDITLEHLMSLMTSMSRSATGQLSGTLP